MKIKSKIIILSVLLIGSLMITPALASTTQAEYQTKSFCKNLETVTVDFIDCTGIIPVKKEITFSKTEWSFLTQDLQKAAKSETSMKEAFASQLFVLHKYGLVSADSDIDDLMSAFNKKINSRMTRGFLNQEPRRSPLNNTVFNALSAISFSLENDNGSTLVFGLNTFINIIGFNIVSLHKGYAPDGIQTNGLISDSVPAGNYTGFIFGFFGYWFGEKISTGVYSNLTCAGLAIITAWIEFP